MQSTKLGVFLKWKSVLDQADYGIAGSSLERVMVWLVLCLYNNVFQFHRWRNVEWHGKIMDVAIMAYYSVLSWHFYGKTDYKKYKTCVRTAHIRTEYVSHDMDSETQDHPNVRHESLLVGRERQPNELDSSSGVLMVTGNTCVVSSMWLTIMDSGQKVLETLP
jgi:hypothetical protein